MRKIELSYSWGPEDAPPLAADALKPRQQALLRNPLMDLLQAVREQGSIAAAAKSLNLSYRHVWGELKKWEQRLNQNLIVWEKGMPAELSEFASKLLWAERQAQARLAAPIESLMAEIERTFAVAFDPQAHLLTLYASYDDALVSLRESTAQQALHLDIRFCGSVDAIRALNEGRCEIAGFHTLSQPNDKSLSAITYKPLLKPGHHKLIGFAKRTQGLLVRTGNPLNIQSLADVVNGRFRYVNRGLGTGTRLLLDELLKNQNIQADQLKGYQRQELSHNAVATCVASGQADAGLAIESAALAAGLDFIPLVTENYWLACLKSALDSPPVAALRQHLTDQRWQTTLQAMPGYQTNQSGNVHSLRNELPWWNLKPRKTVA
ncbi:MULTISPECIES: substrate-binding domain-containing protein [unclassified Limnohabitans]|uniref:helix-turn-helix transcriptional regulator n=1 Tax=unclassified Limnohabitans TaxID=2626134 RepID=UPI0007067B92|nr:MULTISPECIES: substrate-binding domain-containing protein [unclassified Limnohabitans]ALK91646.1 PBP superfamily domain protein [Limnohabitans sp. 103DPR2]MBU3721431.1 LysR family transcriptional regulator [Limnohabitans sp.]